jgi:nucleoside-diphosphate-sugar epimerase
MKQILILGGNRFFGRHLASELLRRGADVTLLNRGNVDDGFGDQVTRLRADRADREQLSTVLRGKSWDRVYDQICYNGRDASGLCELLQGKTGRLIFTSTQSVYGKGYGLRESLFEPTRYEAPQPRDESYGALKREAEAAFAKFSELNVAMARIPIVLGVDDYTGRLKWHVERIAKNLPIQAPNLKARLGFIRSDIAGKVLADLGETSHVGPINCACPGDIAVGEIIARIERATGRKANLVSDDSDSTTSSPFGATEDWTMNLELMEKLRIEATPLENWFDSLVRDLTEASKTP